MDRELFLSALQIGPEDTYVSGKWFFIRLLLAALAAAAVHELSCSRAIYGLNRIVNIVSGKRLNYLFPIRSIKLLISRVIIGNNAPSSFKAWARSLWRVSLDRWDPFWRTCGENNAMWWNIQVLSWVKIKKYYAMWDEVTRLTRDTCHEFFSLVFFSFFFIFILFKVHLWDLPRVLLPRELDAVHLQPKVTLSILHTVVGISLSILVNSSFLCSKM